MVLQPLRHFLIVEPIQDETISHGTLTLFIPDDWKEKHIQVGRVCATGQLTETIPLNSIVLFLGWRGEEVNVSDYGRFKDHMLRLHENDIEAILESW